MSYFAGASIHELSVFLNENADEITRMIWRDEELAEDVLRIIETHIGVPIVSAEGDGTVTHWKEFKKKEKMRAAVTMFEFYRKRIMT